MRFTRASMEGEISLSARTANRSSRLRKVCRACDKIDPKGALDGGSQFCPGIGDIDGTLRYPIM